MSNMPVKKGYPKGVNPNAMPKKGPKVKSVNDKWKPESGMPKNKENKKSAP